MGCSESKNSSMKIIEDKYETYEQVQDAILLAGLEGMSELIFGIDLTQSNEQTGRNSFNGRCLHSIDKTGRIMNPYQETIKILAKTLEKFDDDGRIPMYGFGESRTKSTKVMSFGNRPCYRFDDCLRTYNSIIEGITLSGPTSFAPIIYKSLEIICQNWGYHILVIIADGQITNPTNQTDEAIRIASKFPLSIIVVGVGDGPWEKMEEYDDRIKGREFDNFQFVEFNKTKTGRNPELNFAINALQEIPDQYKYIKKRGMLKKPKNIPIFAKIETVIEEYDEAPPYEFLKIN